MPGSRWIWRGFGISGSPRRHPTPEEPSALYGLSDDGEGGIGDLLSTEPDWGFAIGQKWGFLDDGMGGVSNALSTDPDYGFAFEGGEWILTTDYTHLLSDDLSLILAVGFEEITISSDWTYLLNEALTLLVEI